MTSSIIVSRVSKQYQMGTGLMSFRDLVNRNGMSKVEKYHWALKDVSFELNSGESLGIIGPNGAGKTTILKILSRVTKQTSGEVKMNGRFSALIELGAGFHPDMTGRENIFLNGTILGMKRSEIKARFDQIVEFSGIEDFLETPVKRYSSGMYARLGFSIAAHLDPDILLVDEVLAVGDMGFRAKCYQRMQKLIQAGTTLIFVSHDFDAVQRVCERCLVLNRGQVAFDGTAGDAVAQFSNILRRTADRANNSSNGLGEGLSLSIMTQEAVIEEVKMLDANGEPSLSFESDSLMRIRVRVRFNTDVTSPEFACTIRLPNGETVYDYFTHWAKQETPDFAAGSVAIIEFPMRLSLVKGVYHLGINVAANDLSRYFDRNDRMVDFVVSDTSEAQGIANLKGSFRVLKVESEKEFENDTFLLSDNEMIN
ncbi:MAG: ABC transporter ATP-binding protein [Anaerolineales bacterium]|jgi:lipopolysaccharide transport system ATP-binding protein